MPAPPTLQRPTTTRTRIPRTRIALLTTLAMCAFAGNSLLCRVALKGALIDPATFTSVRVLSAALVLCAILRGRAGPRAIGGNWYSALALFAYAAAFSFAYVGLAAGTGALILFGTVQATMLGYALWTGEHLRARQWAGVTLALAGLVTLVLPGVAAPPVLSSLLMLAAGIAWGVYSLRGRGSSDPLATTAGNFLRALPFAAAMSVAASLTIGLLMHAPLAVERAGLMYAALSGALTSGVGYVIWYAALRELKAASAAAVQLSVPLIAAGGGVVLLDEPLTPRLLASAVAILGGIALVIARRQTGG